MKKEDLCMLLIVLALVLIISRNTKIFEGFSANDLPSEMPDSEKKIIMDMVASGKVSEEQLEQEFGMEESSNNSGPPRPPKPAMPPTPPKPAMPPSMPPTPPKPAMPPAKPPTPPKPAMPPAKPPTPPKPAMPPAKPPTPPKPAMPPAKPPTPPKPAMPPAKRPTPPKPAMPPAKRPTPPKPATPPAKPGIAPSFPTPMEQIEGPTPFGAPFSEDKPGAFGQDFVSAFDRSIGLFAGPEQDMNVIIPSSATEETLTKKYLGSLEPQIMQNLDEVRTQGSVAVADFQPYDPTSMSGSLLDNQFEGLQVGLKQPSQLAQPSQQPVMPPTNRGMVAPPTPKPIMPPTQPMGGGSAKGVELHFVFGEWCGHSRNAKPGFQSLVSRNDVMTANGMPVKFIMTEDNSPGMEQFKGKVQGFPSYMLVGPNGQMEELVGHDRSAESIVSMLQGKTV
jgi:hypothetical protein